MECIFCGKTCKNKNSHTQHTIRCQKNPDKVKIKPSFGMLGKKGRNQYSKARNDGKEYILSDVARENMSNSQKGFKWSTERKLEHSKRMKQAVIDHPESYSSGNVCGRVKLIEFDGVKYKGSWEVHIARLMREIGIDFIYEIPKPFEYIWRGKTHLYFPDFYIPELDLYLEVKGYKRERDFHKWKSVTNLKIIDKELIFSLDKENFLEFCKE